MQLPAPAKRPIRVAYVIQNLNYGGMERVLHSLVRELPRLGFEVHIVVLEYFGRFAEGLESSATLHQGPAMSRLSLIHPRGLADLLRSISPDVVHSHAGVWLKAARASRLARVPVIVHTEHGRQAPVPLVDRLIDNLASRWTDITVAVSDALAIVLREQVVHDPSRVRVIMNGVDTESAVAGGRCDALARELGIPDHALVIGSVGRLEPIKNYRLALRAFARLGANADGGDGPILVLVGDGSERAELEALAIDIGVHSRVRFLGWQADAHRLYPAFDLFTLTSRSEGTSISLLEAMSAGVCPVVTDVGGNGAVLGPELSQLLVQDNDEVALAETWRRLLADHSLRKSTAALARRRVEQEFSLARMIAQHAALYRELVGRASRVHPDAGTRTATASADPYRESFRQ